MTMSVGLARIINDPEASVLVRKALGALSTPGLLVYDTALSIDDTGRIILRLNPDGGLQQDEDGLALAEEPITFGIDSEVELFSEAHDREWNARLTGSAPNFIEGSVAIGTEDLDGNAPAVVASGEALDHPKVNITHTVTQLRLSYDPSNFLSMRTAPSGFVGFFSIGTTEPGYHFISGDGTEAGVSGGIRINYGTTIEQIFALRGTTSWAGGGSAGVASWVDFTFTLTGALTVRPGQDHVSVVPADGTAIPDWWLSWSVRISATNEIKLRVAYWDITLATDDRDWIFLIHKVQA